MESESQMFDLPDFCEELLDLVTEVHLFKRDMKELLGKISIEFQPYLHDRKDGFYHTHLLTIKMSNSFGHESMVCYFTFYKNWTKTSLIISLSDFPAICIESPKYEEGYLSFSKTLEQIKSRINYFLSAESEYYFSFC